ALIMPTDTASMLAASRVRAEHPELATRFAMPEEQALLDVLDFEKLHAKLAGSRLAPLSIRKISDGKHVFDTRLEADAFPLAAYRPLAVSPRGRLVNARKTLVRSASELAALAEQSASEGASLFTAPEAPGTLITVIVSRCHGRTLASFAQRAVHTLNETRAWSSLREVDLRRFVHAAAEEVAVRLDLDGLFVVQFRESGKRTLSLENITPGCPVSSSLALLCDINLPGRLADALLGQQRPSPERKTNGAGRRCGNFYPGECRYLLASEEPGRELPSRTRRFLSVTANQLNPKVGRDYLKLRDPAPGFAQLRRFVRALKKTLKRHTRRIAQRSGQKLMSAGAVREKPPKSLLFLCRGNTCRSYFAAERLKARLDEHGAKGFRVQSAGVTAETGQRPPERFTRLFERYGLKPEAHRSLPLKTVDASGFDLILLMDRQQQDYLLSRRPELLARSIMLGALDDTADSGEPPEIGDPVSASPLAADNAFRRIDALVAELALVMHSQPPSSTRRQDSET
ncbi:MAG: hypothetical protein AAGE85_18380, partial [Pseudomonadota bacterium]